MKAHVAPRTQGFPISVTPYYASLADRHDPTCPIRRQIVPRAEEADEARGDLRDPLGEEAHEVAPELIQRYPDRALLLATDRCAVYCRFCTRSRLVGNGGGPRSLERSAPAFAYLRAHPEVRDLIVSGGDPLAMATSRLTALLARAAQHSQHRDHSPRDARAGRVALAHHERAAATRCGPFTRCG